MSLKHDLDVNKGHKANSDGKKIDKKITMLKVHGSLKLLAS